MQPATACPGAAALEQLLQGKAAPADAVALEQHIAGCTACLQRLAGLAAGNIAAPLPPAAARLLDKARPAKPDALPDALLNTGPMSMTFTEPSLQPGDEISHFLAPAQGPGEMGRLGGYRVLRVLGVGGMGTVYEAQDPALRRHVALKTMKPSAASQTGARDRFLREARAAAALSHDHIVPIYQVGEDRGVPFLAMPLLHGEMLEDRLKRVGRLPVAEALRVGREVAEGLAVAHDHGIIHRDIKPGNIWLEAPSDRAKILDFGLASGQDGDVQLTTPGAIMGTPAYMAPEQAGGAVDHRADLFSLGCVLYRMLTGRLPFAGSSTMEILRNIAVQKPKPPRELNPEIQAGLDQFLLRLLAKEREQRPVSAAVTAKVLKTLEAQQAGSTLLPPAKPPLAVPVGGGAEPPVAQLVQPGRHAPAAAQVRVAPPSAALASPQIQNAPTPTAPNGVGKALAVNAKALRSWALALSPRQKLVGAAAGVTAGVLLLVLCLLIGRGGAHPTGSGSLMEGGGDGSTPGQHKTYPWKFPDSPGPVPKREFQVGKPLNANSLVTRPAAIKGLRSWDIVSDHVNKINPSLSFTREGRLELLTNTRTLWDFDKGFVPAPFGGAYAAISPDSHYCACITPQSVKIFKEGKAEYLRKFLSSGTSSVAWSNDGEILASYSIEGLRFSDPKQVTDISAWKDQPVTSNREGAFAWLPDDRTVLAWLVLGTSVQRVDALKGTVLQQVSVPQLTSVSARPQGDVFATRGYDDSKIRVYDLKPGRLLYTFPDAAVTVPAWSADGTMIAFGVGDAVQVWDCKSWDDVKLLVTLDKPRQRPMAVAFAPHGETLFSYDGDGKLRLWAIPGGQHRGTIVLLESGHWLAVTSEGFYQASEGAAEGGLFGFQAVDDEETNDLSPKLFMNTYKWKNESEKTPLQQLR